MDIGVVNFRSPTAPSEFVTSLHETGFAVLENHSIPWVLVEEIYREWEDFFASQAKFNYRFSQERQDGYFARPVPDDSPSDGARVDGRDDKEFFHLFSWGRVPGEVSGRAAEYRTLAMSLGATLLGWLGDGTPDPVAARFPMPLAETLVGGETQTLLRILRYPPLGDVRTASAMRAGTHRDTNLLTILACGSAPGLEVRVGKTWRAVPWDPATLVINGGVMLEKLTGGFYPAVAHRVAVPAGQAATTSRMSMPLFLHPAPDVVIDGTQTAAEYLNRRLAATYGTQVIP